MGNKQLVPENETNNIPLLPENGTNIQIRTPQGLGSIEAQRFPHLVEAILDQLNNQTLVKCIKVSRPWLTHLNQNKVIKIRKILNDLEKFHFENGWNRFIRSINTEMANKLGFAIKTCLNGNGRKQILPINEIFKDLMVEKYAE